MSVHSQLESVFNPKSIAIIGASKREGSIGNQVLKGLVEGGYEGAIYPINPTADEILGIKTYKAVTEVPGDLDMAVFCVPAKLVLDVARQCAEKKVKGYVVITSGFSEVGDTASEEEMVRIAHAAGGRVVGPNIVGLISNPAKANASFAPALPYPGRTAFVSQSGALLIALDMATFVRKLGMSAMISLGNMSDIDFADCIDYYAADPDTGCISLYVEGIKNGRKFLESGRKAGKPIIALKAGVSASGAAAAASHTGSLAGSVKVYQAAMEQSHVIWADDLDDLLDRSMALAMQPPLKGDNILIVTNGGGIGVLATDSAEKYHVDIKPAPADLQEEFRKCMPDFGSPRNPVDITGGAGLAGYEASIEVALKSDWVDGLVVLYCETAVTNPIEISEGILRAVKNSGVKGKPVVASFVGGPRCVEGGNMLREFDIPMYDNPDKAMSAMGALRQFAKFQEEGDKAFDAYKDVNESGAREIIAKVRKNGRSALTEVEAKEVFRAYGLPVANSVLATSEEQAVEMAKKVGYPVVMKIVSPQILHKSDAGGVKVNLRDEEGIRNAFRTIMANARNYKADADIHGVLIQEMAPFGTEVIVGSVCDAQFGPTVMFGLGGIFVEVLKDVTFRVAPVSKDDAMKMMPEIKGYPILQGARGESRRDQEALSVVLSRFSQMVNDLGDEIAETDANPSMVYEQGKGLKIVDARIILQKK